MCKLYLKHDTGIVSMLDVKVGYYYLVSSWIYDLNALSVLFYELVQFLRIFNFKFFLF